MAIVELNGLTRQHPGASRPAVDQVSLRVDDGEFMVLLGPSGCGKTTTLRMVAGLEPISAGSMSIDGVVMNAVPARNRDIAMVFQSYALYPHMSVRDNLAFGLRRRAIAKSEVERRVSQAAGTLELTPYLDRKPHALSGGQRQRVALGRAIVRDPKVFLFDEPLSNLDAALRVSTRTELALLHQRLSATMIYVTHDQVEAMTMGTRVCIMNAGRIEQVGAPLDVYRWPANTFVAGFLGSPPMNLIEAQLTHLQGQAGLRIGEQPVPGADVARWQVQDLAGSAVTLGIRPEDLTLADDTGLPAQVVNTEALGGETLVTLQLPQVDKPLRARLDRDFVPRRGDNVRLRLDSARMRLFDPATGTALLQHPA